MNIDDEYRTNSKCVKIFMLKRRNSRRSLTRSFKDCTNVPIIRDNNNTKRIDLILSPEPHLMIGIVNTAHSR